MNPLFSIFSTSLLSRALCLCLVLGPVITEIAPGAEPRPGVLLSVDRFTAIGVDRSVAASVTEILRAELARSSRLRLLEETGRLFRLQRNSARFRDLINENALLELGELLESRRVLTGSVSRLDTLLVITARVVDAETGVALAGEMVEHAAGPAGLTGAVRSLARKLLAHFPLAGLVTEVLGGGDTLVAGLGLADGLLPGQELTVFDPGEDESALPAWSAAPRRSVRVRVVDAGDRTCRLVPLIPGQAQALRPGAMVVSAVAAGDDGTIPAMPGRKISGTSLERSEQATLGSVVVESIPAGALVALSGLDVGRTPVRVSHLAPGRHQVFIQLAGYHQVIDSVTVVPGSLQKHSFKLEQRFGRLTVVTVQPDVSLLIDTLEFIIPGRGTVTLEEFPAGEHTIRASKPGYRTWQQRLVLELAQDTTIEVDLDPHPGSLLVSSNPSGAEIFIDGVHTGRHTPWRLARLGSGEHRLRVNLPGYGAAVETVHISPGKDLSLELEITQGWFDYTPSGMVLVPAGWLELGGGQAASLDSFYIDIYEVTNRQYLYFIAATGHKPPPQWEEGEPSGQEMNQPVVNVSWEDAAGFAAWTGKRLPTEYEWLRAACGRELKKFPWGDSYRPGGANTWSEGLGAPADAGSYDADISPFGAYDMVGNVFEWVDAWLGRTDSGQPGLYRAYLGGSYYINDTDPSLLGRDGHYPGSRNKYIGFRCARDVHIHH
ncbi:MAG: PEGA domain-containing protein [Gemmatimonadota bacterium]|nr:PEGA domain-containing protein [Gemmatimonadota bacterium]